MSYTTKRKFLIIVFLIYFYQAPGINYSNQMVVHTWIRLGYLMIGFEIRCNARTIRRGTTFFFLLHLLSHSSFIGFSCGLRNFAPYKYTTFKV